MKWKGPRAPWKDEEKIFFKCAVVGDGLKEGRTVYEI
jgi:hypothetical protein